MSAEPYRRLVCISLLAGLALGAAPLVARAADKPETSSSAPVSYYRDVRRIFQQHCQGCHQPAKPQGGYVMTSHADLLKPGDRGHAGIVPGNRPEPPRRADHLPRTASVPPCPRARIRSSPTRSTLIKQLDRRGCQGRHASHRRDVIDDKHPPVYKLAPVVTSSIIPPTATCSPSPASTKCCCTRPTAPARRPADRRCRSAFSPWPFRPTASNSPSPAARPDASARSRSGTSPRRSSITPSPSPSTPSTA